MEIARQHEESRGRIIPVDITNEAARGRMIARLDMVQPGHVQRAEWVLHFNS